MSIEKERLTKLLEMLSSDQQGERANAAAMISGHAKRAQQTVTGYIVATLGATKAPRPAQNWYLDRLSNAIEENDDSCLNAWEADFVQDILVRAPSPLSPRQREIVERITLKLKQGGR